MTAPDEIETLRKFLIDHRTLLGGYRAFARRAAIGESWIYKFVQGRIPNPGRSQISLLKAGIALVGELPKLDS